MTVKDRIRNLSTETLSNRKYLLSRVTYDWRHSNGEWRETAREVFNRGDGAAILPFDPVRRTVLLTRQFRFPAFANGFDGLLIEAAAGLLDDADPATRIRHEAEEELGFELADVTPIGAFFTSPGAVTEKIHLFVARYDAGMKTGAGGGLIEEGEEIEVFEAGINDALEMLSDGRICDAKTAILLQHAALHLFPR
jgi:nudix-type nucleoside diphosphatase (YffH/AdpP family)